MVHNIVRENAKIGDIPYFLKHPKYYAKLVSYNPIKYPLKLFGYKPQVVLSKLM